MNCVFCCKLVPDWEESVNSLRKPALQNPSLFDFFCRQLGVVDNDGENSRTNSLEKVPNCEECYLIYDELQIVYIQLEALKCEVDRHIGDLKKRVVDSAVDDLGQSDDQSDDVTHVAHRFRQQIIKSNQPQNAVSDLLASCSGYNGIVKSEQQEIKLEPLDIDMGTFSDDEAADDYEIDPRNYTQDNDSDSDLNEYDDEEEESLDNYDGPSTTENSSERSTRKTRETTKNSPAKQKIDKERKSSKTSTMNKKSPKVSKPKVERKTRVKGLKKRGRPPKVSKIPEKYKAKRMIISSDESDDEPDVDENQGKSTSSSKNKLPCPTCGKYFPKPSKLQRHQLIVHEKQRPFTCTICDKSFARKHAFIMHLIHTHETEDKPLECPNCSKKFTLQILLDRHVGLHKFDVTKPLNCEICDVRFHKEKPENLERHIQLTHTKRPNSFLCDSCNISFQNRNLLLKHDHQFHMDKFIHKCTVCEKRYSIQELLDTHILTHSEKGPYQCTVCRWEVLTAELLSEHLLSHTGEKRLKCKDCEERFFSLAELKRHGVHVHGAEKPFQCKFCKNRYILNSDRTAHVREVHAGFPNQFKCDICQKGFANKKYLSNHIKKIHELQNVVVCAVCGKSLAGPSSLRDHMNSHEGIKPYECSYCSKRFVKKNSLKCHLMIHTGEKPFVCEICGKSYNQSHCLKTHMKSHTNSKPTSSVSNNITGITGTGIDSTSSSNSAISVSHHPVPINPVYSMADHISFPSFYQNL